jgi:enoyl-CoA hydratase
MDPSTYSTFAIEIRENGLTIATINRPKRMNAVNATLHSEIIRLLSEANTSPEVKVLIITGSGRAFCAGGDMVDEDDTRGPYGSTWPEAQQIVDRFLECEKPIISAVNGYAMGLGATIALLADIVFAARSAIFADTHVKMAVGAGDGGQFIWPLLVGVGRAKYFLMTGERLTADEAERIGLVSRVFDDEKLMDEALRLGNEFAHGPTRAISASKMALNHHLRTISASIMPVSLALENATMRTADAVEAELAFQEKREPKFIGN